MSEGAHRYVVAPVNQGAEGLYSNEVSVEVWPYWQTAAKVEEAASPDANTVYLRWSHAHGAEQFKIYEVTESGELTYICDVAGFEKTLTEVPGGRHVYALRPTLVTEDGQIQRGYASEGVEVEVMFPWQAAPVLDVIKQIGANTLTLRWSHPYGVEGVNLYELKDGAYVYLANVRSNEYQLKNVSEGNHIYMVRPAKLVDGKAQRGNASEALSITVVSGWQLPVKVDQAYSSYAGMVMISWTPTEAAEEYIIYEMVNDRPVLQQRTQETSVILRQVQEGKHIYRIVPSNPSQKAQGQPADTKAIQVDAVWCQPPKPEKSALSFGNTVMLSWEELPEAEFYNVYRKEGNQYQYINQTREPWFILRDVEAGTHTYAVCGGRMEKNLTKRGPMSEDVVVTVYNSRIEAPQIVKIESTGKNTVVLTWTEVEGTNRYYIYRIVNGQLKNVGTQYGGNSRIFTNVAAGEQIFVIYATYTESGRLTRSALSQPAKVNVRAWDLKVSDIDYAVLRRDTVKLTWKGSSDADAYQIERRGQPQSSSNPVISQVRGWNLFHYDMDVQSGKTYYYRIRALDDQGNAGEWSNYIEVKIP